MLKGQVALITGASRGIGAAIARKLASMGADVALVYSGSAAESVCAECAAFGGKAKAYQCNVADFGAAKELVAQVKKEFGTVNILVNNAGIAKDGLVATMREQDFDDVINVNLKGAFNMIRHCTPLFIRNRGGRIINISSVTGLMGNAGQANYAASKAGLIGLTKSVARELAPRSVTCNAIAPGFILTDMTKDLQDSPLAAQIPLGHMGSVEDVADAAAYLACAGYVTGETIRVDGGIAM